MPDDFPLSPVEGRVAPRRGDFDWIDAMPGSVNLRGLLEDVEKKLIARALKSGGGIRAEAARRLELSRSHLAYKLTKYRFQPDGDQ